MTKSASPSRAACPLAREHVEHAELVLRQAQQLAVVALDGCAERARQLEARGEEVGHRLHEPRRRSQRPAHAAGPVVEHPPHARVDVVQVLGEHRDGRLRVRRERAVRVRRIGEHHAVADADVETADDRVLLQLGFQRVVG